MINEAPAVQTTGAFLFLETSLPFLLAISLAAFFVVTCAPLFLTTR